MTLAAETRAAVRARPFLLEALRAGVVNYAAAARAIDVAEDTEAVATALRRYAERLPARETEARRARVTMHGGLEPVARTDVDLAAGEDGGDDTAAQTDEPLLVVGDTGYADAEGSGDLTGVLATGDVDAAALSTVLGVLAAHGVEPEAAGVAGDALVVVVAKRDGPETVQRVEEALEAVPTDTPA